MNLEVLKSEKHELDVSLDSVTVSEILRVYLHEQGVDFSAWKREHPSKPVLLKIRTTDKNASKVVSDAILAIKKDCDSILSAIKK